MFRFIVYILLHPSPHESRDLYYFVDELIHSQHWCAGACQDHILGASGCKSDITSEFSKGTWIA